MLTRLDAGRQAYFAIIATVPPYAGTAHAANFLFSVHKMPRSQFGTSVTPTMNPSSPELRTGRSALDLKGRELGHKPLILARPR